MIEWAALQVMILGLLLTLVYFEFKEVEKHNALTHTYLPSIKASTVGTLITTALLTSTNCIEIIVLNLMPLSWYLIVLRRKLVLIEGWLWLLG